MTDRSESERLRASREATDWLILLQEAPQDPETRRRFEAWLNASPVHEASWATTQRTASAIAAARPVRRTSVDARQTGYRPSVGPAVSETLLPGDVVRMSASGAIVRDERALDTIAAWRAGRLIARDETVEAVVDRLRRHYRGVIFLTDRDLAGRSVTGIYNLADPVAALRAIGASHDANVRQITPWVVVISGR